MPPARARILVAEDQAAVAQQIINRFTLLGHDVRWAKAVREVRAELSSFHPDVLILDATLDTDGLELFQAIRFAAEHPRAGVVILTAAGDVGARERAQQLGAASVMMKPVRNDDLVEIVEDLLTYI
jgi:DNA-binding response OmpR family regulator